MTLLVADRVLETCSAPGTGAVSLLGAQTGYQTFSAGVGNGNTTYYTISDQAGTNWEVGLGTYTLGPNTLTRTTVLASSNAGSLVNFNSGTQNVFVTYPSEKSVFLDASGNVSPLGTVASGTWQGTAITTPYGGTGLTSYTAGDLPYYASGTALSKLAIGTNGYILQSNGSAPIWVAASSISTPPGGATTQVQYNSSGAFAGSANMTFNGTSLTLANDATIHGLTVGLGGGAVASNTAVGVGALLANTSGTVNTAFGYQALEFNQTGIYNSAFGTNALNASTGDNNAAFGSAVLFSSTGDNNSAFGSQSLYNNTTGSNNVAVGYQALEFNTTASNNTAVGYQAGYSNTGANIVYVGNQAGYAMLNGGTNIAVGSQAMAGSGTTANNTGTANIAIGFQSLNGVSSGGNNVAIGQQALALNTTASNNTAVGYQAGYSNTTANYGTFLGAQAGYTNSTGLGNTFLGYVSGTLATGNYGTYVGYGSGVAQTTGDKNTYVGYGAGSVVTTGANNTVLGGFSGNFGPLDIRTASNYVVLSDGAGNPRQWANNLGITAIPSTTYAPNINLTDAATVAWDTATGQVATFTFVSSNRTMGAPTNLVNGGFYALAVIQNGGGNTLTWNSVFKWISGSAPTLSTAAGAKDYFTFRSDGTNLYQQGASLGVA